MKKAMMLLSTLLISFAAHASFYKSLGLPGEFPEEDAKEEILQNILLDSAEIAFASTDIHITLETSLTEIKKYYPMGEGFMKILLKEAAVRFEAQGCTLSYDKNMASDLYYNKIKAPRSPSGIYTRIYQLAPLLNSLTNCP